MIRSLLKQAGRCGWFCGVAWIALTTGSARAQTETILVGHGGSSYSAPPCATTVSPSSPTTPTTPPSVTPGQPGTAEPALPGVGGPLTGRSETSAYLGDPSYIDSAIPRTQIRFRFDTMFDNNRPDRGEFFYPKCGCFLTPDAKGPPLPETNIDSNQEVSAYLEYAVSDRLSVFGEVPVRLINPEQNANESGLGDVNAGFKFALIQDDCRTVTFQFRTYFPTGDGFKGLGTEHYSFEPAILLYQQVSERVAVHAELRDWFTSGGSDFASNVVRYGVGASTLAYESCSVRVYPVIELVGWTFLGGKEFAPDIGVQDADGDTIVNAKAGVRVGLGDRSELAVSYGRALTGEILYKDIVRAELRYRF